MNRLLDALLLTQLKRQGLTDATAWHVAIMRAVTVTERRRGGEGEAERVATAGAGVSVLTIGCGSMGLNDRIVIAVVEALMKLAAQSGPHAAAAEWHVSFANNSLTDRVAPHLELLLVTCAALRRLDISGNAFSPNGLLRISEAYNRLAVKPQLLLDGNRTVLPTAPGNYTVNLASGSGSAARIVRGGCEDAAAASHPAAGGATAAAATTATTSSGGSIDIAAWKRRRDELLREEGLRDGREAEAERRRLSRELVGLEGSFGEPAISEGRSTGSVVVTPRPGVAAAGGGGVGTTSGRQQQQQQQQQQPSLRPATTASGVGGGVGRVAVDSQRHPQQQQNRRSTSSVSSVGESTPASGAPATSGVVGAHSHSHRHRQHHRQRDRRRGGDDNRARSGGSSRPGNPDARRAATSSTSSSASSAEEEMRKGRGGGSPQPQQAPRQGTSAPKLRGASSPPSPASSSSAASSSVDTQATEVADKQDLLDITADVTAIDVVKDYNSCGLPLDSILESQQLRGITVLCLANVGLAGELPAGVFPTSLVRLDVSNNAITSIGAALLPCRLLSVLSARRNQLRAIGKCLRNNVALAHLFLGRNCLRSLAGLSHLVALEVLDVSFNELATEGAFRCLSLHGGLRHLVCCGNPAFLPHGAGSGPRTLFHKNPRAVLRNLVPSLVALDNERLAFSRHSEISSLAMSSMNQSLSTTTFAASAGDRHSVQIAPRTARTAAAVGPSSYSAPGQVQHKMRQIQRTRLAAHTAVHRRVQRAHVSRREVLACLAAQHQSHIEDAVVNRLASTQLYSPGHGSGGRVDDGGGSGSDDGDGDGAARGDSLASVENGATPPRGSGLRTASQGPAVRSHTLHPEDWDEQRRRHAMSASPILAHGSVGGPGGGRSSARRASSEFCDGERLSAAGGDGESVVGVESPQSAAATEAFMRNVGLLSSAPDPPPHRRSSGASSRSRNDDEGANVWAAAVVARPRAPGAGAASNNLGHGAVASEKGDSNQLPQAKAEPISPAYPLLGLSGGRHDGGLHLREHPQAQRLGSPRDAAPVREVQQHQRQQQQRNGMMDEQLLDHCAFASPIHKDPNRTEVSLHHSASRSGGVGAAAAAPRRGNAEATPTAATMAEVVATPRGQLLSPPPHAALQAVRTTPAQQRGPWLSQTSCNNTDRHASTFELEGDEPIVADWLLQLQQDATAIRVAFRTLLIVLHSHNGGTSQERRRCLDIIHRSDMLADTEIPAAVVEALEFTEAELNQEPGSLQGSPAQLRRNRHQSQFARRQQILQRIHVLGESKTCMRYIVALIENKREDLLEQYLQRIGDVIPTLTS